MSSNDLSSTHLIAGAERAIPIRALHVLILGGLSALGPLSTDMYLPALPALSRELGATMSQTQLTLSAGILGLALGQVLAGPSSDDRAQKSGGFAFWQFTFGRVGRSGCD